MNPHLFFIYFPFSEDYLHRDKRVKSRTKDITLARSYSTRGRALAALERNHKNIGEIREYELVPQYSDCCGGCVRVEKGDCPSRGDTNILHCSGFKRFK